MCSYQGLFRWHLFIIRSEIKLKNMTNRQQGFTLIELLVVIAIIGILSSVVLASLNSAREKSRDARRISDIKQLQLALELYFDSNAQYPTSAGVGVGAVVSSGFIASTPTDPVSGNVYGYGVNQPGTDYILQATLEDVDHQALDSDIDVDQYGVTCADASGEYCAKP